MNSYIRNVALFIFIKANAIDFIMLPFLQHAENKPSHLFSKMPLRLGVYMLLQGGRGGRGQASVLCISTCAQHPGDIPSRYGFGHPSVQITVSSASS